MDFIKYWLLNLALLGSSTSQIWYAYITTTRWSRTHVSTRWCCIRCGLSISLVGRGLIRVTLFVRSRKVCVCVCGGEHWGVILYVVLWECLQRGGGGDLSGAWKGPVGSTAYRGSNKAWFSQSSFEQHYLLSFLLDAYHVKYCPYRNFWSPTTCYHILSCS